MGYRPLVHSLSIGLVSRNLRQRAEARPTGRAVSKERLGDWDRPTMVPRVPAKKVHENSSDAVAPSKHNSAANA